MRGEFGFLIPAVGRIRLHAHHQRRLGYLTAFHQALPFRLSLLFANLPWNDLPPFIEQSIKRRLIKILICFCLCIYLCICLCFCLWVVMLTPLWRHAGVKEA